MLRQQIFLDDVLLLTIFHDTMDSGLASRFINESENTDFGELKFIEELVGEVGTINFDEVNQGFLENKNKKNPYYSYSVNFKEFISYDKPLFEDGNLKVESEIFTFICDFIGRKSGYKIIESPYSIGNVLIFRPNKIECNYFEYKKNISGIEVKGLSNESITIVKLKNLDVVKETYVINGVDCKINPKYEWSSFDIEVYENGNIVHAEYDVHLIRCININSKIVSKQISTELKTLPKSIDIKSSTNMPIIVGESLDSQLVDYFNNENLFSYELRNKNSKDLYFLGKGESEKAFEIFEEIMDSSCEEIWIFDPYFINYEIVGGIDRLRDILKILLKNRDVKKNIVFESKGDLSNFIDKINDEEIKLISKRFNGLNIDFYETEEHFHDRFFFLRNKKSIVGYLIGTSLNSFGENYSTLIKLKSNDAKFIFTKLTNEIVSNKIIDNCSL
ncbi:VPA1262 family N-terminal domain-containing protein [Paraclostridium sordellii]|uniref:VPA1262 family N-terminal domain-containing protein n=1 Tax=Paraclostridium sordellii TaxID=1505 RepID=UPI0005E35638|nr:VPA1262 family N-terminal domain-containing protein [Paeniclostridium sordellii]CEN23964.1 Uncharacterised protein [[Clostridium] sordellii] [Paeniclostridium sordellii]